MPATARVLRAVKRAGTDVRLLALGPSSDARTLFGGILGPKAFTPLVERPDETEEPPPPTDRPLPELLIALGALFLLALAAHERYAGRLALPEGGDVKVRVRDFLVRRELLLVVAAAAFVLAGFLVLVAIDVGRWRTAIADRRRALPRLLARRAVEPGHGRALRRAAGRCSAVDDDVAFRRALTSLRASALDDPTVSDPNLAVHRTQAAERLESIVVHDRDPMRRSRAANLLGVLGMVVFNSGPSGGTLAPDRSELLLNAIASFEQAIAINPDNDEAKYNLQVILLRGQGLLPTEAAAGRNPAPGGRGSRGAGAGSPGGGY